MIFANFKHIFSLTQTKLSIALGISMECKTNSIFFEYKVKPMLLFQSLICLFFTLLFVNQQ